MRKVLVVDIGGTNVKAMISREGRRKFASGGGLTPRQLHVMQLTRSKTAARGEFTPPLARDHGLDVGAADIDDENFSHARLRSSRLALIGINFSALLACNSAAALRVCRERSRKCNCAWERAAPSAGRSRT